MRIRVKKVNDKAMLPTKAYEMDACFDLCSVENVEIPPGMRVPVSTGLQLAIPEGYEGQIRPRSGISLRTPLLIANSPGTIDSGYRGDIKIILFNTSISDTLTVGIGDRIAQLAILPVLDVVFEETDKLEKTERSNKGFGSTGK